jgi:signal transduction histidine kinase
VEVIEQLDPSLPLAPIDGMQLRHAFLNIIKNSFEAMPGGGTLSVDFFQEKKKGRPLSV